MVSLVSSVKMTTVRLETSEDTFQMFYFNCTNKLIVMSISHTNMYTIHSIYTHLTWKHPYIVSQLRITFIQLTFNDLMISSILWNDTNQCLKRWLKVKLRVCHQWLNEIINWSIYTLHKVVAWFYTFIQPVTLHY